MEVKRGNYDMKKQVTQLEEINMKFTENSTLGELLSNETTAKILEKHLPGISTNPMASMGKSFPLEAA